jgi:hypothetical protein
MRIFWSLLFILLSTHISFAQLNETVWVDEELPEGAETVGDRDNWYWVNVNPSAFSGRMAHQSLSHTGTHSHGFNSIKTPFEVSEGEILFTYVFLDAYDSPHQVLLQWHEGETTYSAYWGPDLIDTQSNIKFKAGTLPEAGRWVRLEVSADALELAGKKITGMTFMLDRGRATWDRTGKASDWLVEPEHEEEFVWWDDSIPAGARLDVIDDVWNWTSTPRAFSENRAHTGYVGKNAHRAKFRMRRFFDAHRKMDLTHGDIIYTYVYLDPAAVPDQIILEWNDGLSWEHRAYWGKNAFSRGVHGTDTLRYMGPMPKSGSWQRLEIPVNYVGLEGKSVSGMGFGAYREAGKPVATWDRTGKVREAAIAAPALHSVVPLYRFYNSKTGHSYSTRDVTPPLTRLERIQCYVFPAYAANTSPVHVFRPRNKRSKGYIYTLSHSLGQSNGWEYEGVGFHIFSEETENTVPLYEFRTGQGFFYTTDMNEGVRAGFAFTKILGYVFAEEPVETPRPEETDAPSAPAEPGPKSEPEPEPDGDET